MTGMRFPVTASAGSLRPAGHTGISMPHQWTDEGVVVEASFTGGDLAEIPKALRSGPSTGSTCAEW